MNPDKNFSTISSVALQDLGRLTENEETSETGTITGAVIAEGIMNKLREVKPESSYYPATKEELENNPQHLQYLTNEIGTIFDTSNRPVVETLGSMSEALIDHLTVLSANPGSQVDITVAKLTRVLSTNDTYNRMTALLEVYFIDTLDNYDNKKVIIRNIHSFVNGIREKTLREKAERLFPII